MSYEVPGWSIIHEPATDSYCWQRLDAYATIWVPWRHLGVRPVGISKLHSVLVHKSKRVSIHYICFFFRRTLGGRMWYPYNCEDVLHWIGFIHQKTFYNGFDSFKCNINRPRFLARDDLRKFWIKNTLASIFLTQPHSFGGVSSKQASINRFRAPLPLY